VSNYARDLIDCIGVSSEQTNNAYIKRNRGAHVKERILLVRRVRIEGYEASKISTKRELHKSR
jgi:hypothetical protein